MTWLVLELVLSFIHVAAMAAGAVLVAGLRLLTIDRLGWLAPAPAAWLFAEGCAAVAAGAWASRRLASVARDFGVAGCRPVTVIARVVLAAAGAAMAGVVAAASGPHMLGAMLPVAQQVFTWAMPVAVAALAVLAIEWRRETRDPQQQVPQHQAPHTLYPVTRRPVTEAPLEAKLRVPAQEDPPAFEVAVERLRSFLLSQNIAGRLLWVFEQDISRQGKSIRIAMPIPEQNASRARDAYNAACTKGLGVLLEVVCSLGSDLCCAVWSPTDETDAEYAMMPRGLKLRVPTPLPEGSSQQ